MVNFPCVNKLETDQRSRVDLAPVVHGIVQKHKVWRAWRGSLQCYFGTLLQPCIIKRVSMQPNEKFVQHSADCSSLLWKNWLHGLPRKHNYTRAELIPENKRYKQKGLLSRRKRTTVFILFKSCTIKPELMYVKLKIFRSLQEAKV